jgi:hypothetical protein
MNDDDIYAFNPPPDKAAGPAPADRPPVRRRRLWPWLLGAALLFVLLAVTGMVVLATSLLDSAAQEVQVVVDGQPWQHDGPAVVAAALAVTAVLLAVGGALLLGLLFAAVVVPLVLVLALLGVAVCLLFGLAGPLLAVVALAVVLLSPLWLALALLWWLLRRRPSGAASSAATMHA